MGSVSHAGISQREGRKQDKMGTEKKIAPNLSHLERKNIVTSSKM
jgi:hypothetical protein